MKKRYIAINILFFIAIMTADSIFAATDAIAAKAAASLCFTAECVFNVIICARKKAKMRFSVIMLAGITAACAADIALYYDLITGMALFGIGHILYFISYCVCERLSLRDFIPGAISSAGLFVVIFTAPILDFGEGAFMTVAVCAYAVIISVMVGKALSDVIRRKSRLNIVIAVGSGMFWISDFALMFSIFGDIKFAGLICLFTYYPAQFVLSLSPLIFAHNREKALSENA